MEITTRPRSRHWRWLAGRLSVLAAAMGLCLLLPASLGLSQHVVGDDAMGGGLARGTLLLERPVTSADQLRVGDVITFPVPGADELVTRRVVAVDAASVVTRGDARTLKDPWLIDVESFQPTLTVFIVPLVGYPELFVPGLTWTVLAVLVALAALGAVVLARRQAGRDLVLARPLPRATAAAT